MKDSYSKSYADAGVDITAGYKAVDLMKNISRAPSPTEFAPTWADSADYSIRT